LWQTSTTTRAEFKKQIDNRIDIRDNWNINVYENEFQMTVSCGRSSTMVGRSYMLFCSTRENSFPLWLDSPSGPRPHLWWGFDSTLRHTTLGRMSDRSVTDTCNLTVHKSQETFMPAVGFEHAIPASERPQNHALDRAATGIGIKISYIKNNTFQTTFCYYLVKICNKIFFNSLSTILRSNSVIAYYIHRVHISSQDERV
jgi:hypothetical protein